MPFIIGFLIGLFLIYKIGQHGIFATIGAFFKGCLTIVLIGFIILLVLAFIIHGMM